MKGKNGFKITPSIIASILAGNDVTSYQDKFVLARINNNTKMPKEDSFMLDSYLAIFCESGDIQIELNVQGYHLQAGDLVMATPGNLIRIDTSLYGTKVFSTTIMCISPEFFEHLSLDLSKILSEALSIMRQPYIHLAHDEILLLSSYVDMIKRIFLSNNQYAMESVSALGVSMFYHFAGYINMHLDTGPQKRKTNRQKLLFEKFLKLAIENHKQEHLLKFYADKLYVTPKYLSKIVKEVSGRAAPDWINHFIMQSAKYMLRNTDMSIKNVSAELHFQNLPFFFRYFKSHSGVTPNEYRQA